jgi:DNA-directed RNA polymerase specialized sigma subunit
MTQHSDDWLNPTREMLNHWAEHLRSIKSDRLGYSSKAAYLSEPVEDASIPEDDIADKMDRVLCKVKAINEESFRVLSLYYFHEYSERAIGLTLNKSKTKCRDLRLSGEIMVATMIHDEKNLIPGA